MSDVINHPTFTRECIGLLLDILPISGSIKSVGDLAKGKDVVTGEHINRWLAAGGIILGFIPFGKLVVKGKRGVEVAETIASKIAYDAPSKEALVKKLEHIVPTTTKDVEESVILREIRQLNHDELSRLYNMKLVDYSSKSNLINQYIVQTSYGGHAVYKHWFVDGKQLTQLLAAEEQKIIASQATDAEAAFEYLKIVLKDPKTIELSLDGERIGFANAEKKILIIHNPTRQGTFYYHKDPINALNKIRKEELQGK